MELTILVMEENNQSIRLPLIRWGKYEEGEVCRRLGDREWPKGVVKEGFSEAVALEQRPE